MAKKEKPSNLKVSEYKLTDDKNPDQTLQSVPTIKVSELKDLDMLNEIINEMGDDRNNLSVVIR
jgi:hypothetical protein